MSVCAEPNHFCGVKLLGFAHVVVRARNVLVGSSSVLLRLEVGQSMLIFAIISNRSNSLEWPLIFWCFLPNMDVCGTY